MLIESAKKWFSQLTWKSIAAASFTAFLFLSQSWAIDVMLEMGLWHSAAVRINKFALGASILMMWFVRSPAETPLFSKTPPPVVPVIPMDKETTGV